MYLSVIPFGNPNGYSLRTAQGFDSRQYFAGMVYKKVIPAFSGRILNVDMDVAMRCAELHVPDPRSDRDALIAATALTHKMSVVTRNCKDFEPMGVPIINPWTC